MVHPNCQSLAADINECSEEGTCEDDEFCENTPGSYKCKSKYQNGIDSSFLSTSLNNSSFPFIGTPPWSSNSVHIKEVAFGDKEHLMLSCDWLPGVLSSLRVKCPFKE